MSKELYQNLDKIVDSGIDILLNNINRGIEKETLRVDASGKLSQKPHPERLGSALTHPSITTDFCEAQLEFVSPVMNDLDSLTDFLTTAHHYTYQNIGDEKLWASSMPARLSSDDTIPIARFGSSNVAQMKETYRLGLGNRYGRLMQTISGIHYNWSLPMQFWQHYLEDSEHSLQDEVSHEYFSLIRNFHRNMWLLLLLFGASPAVCESFVRGRKHDLKALGKKTFYAPYATSLRMSDFGYSNTVQSGIMVCYNEPATYANTLREATLTPHADYQKIGIKQNGEYRQLSGNKIQIENEFYGSIRPKQIAESGESPSQALLKRGVQYVEVRCLDLNPLEPIGINQETMIFTDMFLLYCAFSASPPLDINTYAEAANNKDKVVMEGRKPGLMLHRHGRDISLVDWAEEMFEGIAKIAALLDKTHFTSRYSQVVERYHKQIQNPDTLLSAQILQQINDAGSFFDFGMQQSEHHESFFKKHMISDATKEKFIHMAAQSLVDQKRVELSDETDFDTYLADYFSRL